MPDQQSQTVQLSAKAQQQLGMIPGTRFYTPFPFAGMNVQSSSIAIADQEFAWLENFFRVGDGKLRTAWDVGIPLIKRSGIVSFFSFNIGTVYYFAVFFSDGTAVQVNATTGATTTISSIAGTFFVPGGSLPACSQWGAIYLLISNRNTPNDYWIWDGTTLYGKGTLAPGLITMLSNGLNYTSTPTVTVYGGSGTGVVLTPTVNQGGVIELAIANPGTGYQPGDIVQAAFSGGGGDTSAILTANLSSGGVTACNITAPGSGYTHATVAFSGGGGSGAAGTVLIGGGVASVAVGSGGLGYTTASVSFVGGGGSGATATATVTAGSVASIAVTSAGSGYTSVPTVVITGDGTGATATATLSSGVVTGILMTNPGTEYTSAPGVVISGDGTSATAQAVISSSGVASVNVVNPGSDFNIAPLITFEGGGGIGAAGVVNITATSVASVSILTGGSGYQVAPTVSFSGGGGGTGAAATAVIASGQVVAIHVTDAGSGYTNTPDVTITAAKGDTGIGANAQALLVPTTIASVTISNPGSGYTSAPAVVISPGANNAAYASVLNLMPYGVSGDSLETFQSRVFICNPAPGQFTTIPPGGNFAFSAPESVSDFATSAGGGLEQSTDSFLQTRYVAVRQTNGYLYFFGDGSVSVLSNIQTTGNPPATTFNFQNVDPQIGCLWRDSRQDFSRTILFGNDTGDYGLYGGAVTKISSKLDQIFIDAFPIPPLLNALIPSGASATIFEVQHYLMLLTIKDPNTGSIRNAMIHWNQKEWGIASQSVNLIYIGTQKLGSKLFAWGTDGNALYPLFNQPSASLTKTLYTKQYGADSPYMVKNFLDFYVQANDKSSGKAGVSFSAQLNIGGIQSQNIQNPNNPLASVPSENLPGAGLIAPPVFAAGSITTNWPTFGVGTGGIPFITMGLALSSTSPDFELGNLSLAYIPEMVNQ